RAVMDELVATTDPEGRIALMQEAQRIIAEDFVNAYLFQLPALTVARAGVQGLWPNAPVAAIDLSGLSWGQ
ncbi:MAG: ABC transporter substrate-binding protein, partial [Rubellimicrobium sp.]|nr:ABC transporter substrate-binding protein [Rubellimicrobium sp.]